jgi:hypothetical protein
MASRAAHLRTLAYAAASAAGTLAAVFGATRATRVAVAESAAPTATPPPPPPSPPPSPPAQRSRGASVPTRNVRQYVQNALEGDASLWKGLDVNPRLLKDGAVRLREALSNAVILAGPGNPALAEEIG